MVIKKCGGFFFLFFLHGFSIENGQQGISYNGLRLCAGGALKHEIFNSPLNLIKKQKI